MTKKNNDEIVVSCKYCDEENLHWKSKGLLYRLYNESGDMHDCPVCPLEEREVTCNRCGKGGLFWCHTDDNAVLVDSNGKKHKCKLKSFDLKERKW